VLDKNAFNFPIKFDYEYDLSFYDDDAGGWSETEIS